MKRIIGYGAVVLLTGILFLTGCETSDNPDTVGVNDYFNENPYSEDSSVADPQQGTGASLQMSAGSTAIEAQAKTVLSASGGTAPYSWFVDRTLSGNISPSTGSSVTFTATSVSGYTSVSVVDAKGDVVRVVIQTI
ncbi:MAG: hypothetical protein EOL87_14565 [Spartobacteria bacterium]|nr:hypothetical protein [Spartobacteria bacterium]